MTPKDEICYLKYIRFLVIAECTARVLIFYLFICYYKSVFGAIIYVVVASILEGFFSFCKKDILFLINRFHKGLVDQVNTAMFNWFKFRFCKPLSKLEIIKYYCLYMGLVLGVMYLGDYIYGE